VHGKQDGRFMSNGKDSRDVSSKKSGLVRCFLNNFRLGLDGLGARPLDGRVTDFRAT
jgi:hypothetical protein